MIVYILLETIAMYEDNTPSGSSSVNNKKNRGHTVCRTHYSFNRTMQKDDSIEGHYKFFSGKERGLIN